MMQLTSIRFYAHLTGFVCVLCLIIAGCSTSPHRDAPNALRTAELAFNNGRANEVISILTHSSPRGLSPELTLRYWGLLAAAYRFVGQPVQAVAQLDRRDGLYPPLSTARRDNQLAILTTLNTLNSTALNHAARTAGNEQLRDWIDIARLFRSTTNHSIAEVSYQSWRAAHNHHPALPELAEVYYGARAGHYPANSRVAVLLPKGGRFADASHAIRTGLMAAYDANHSGARPYLHVPSAQTPAVYDAAVTAGSDVVIGPLEKTAVDELVSRRELPVPTLALNRISDDSPNSGRQLNLPDQLTLFALSPEDEAINAAQYAWASGLRSALLLAPQGQWGTRLASAFRSAFRALGGTVVREQVYGATSGGYGAAIGSLLAGSKADVIFVVATNTVIDELWPLLEQANRTQLPVITTSHVHDGLNNVVRESGLIGLYFVDIPWLLEQNAADPLTREQLQATLPGVTGPLARLYAMGIDAYRVAPYAAALRQDPGLVFSGATGELSVDPQGVMVRQLALAQFTATGVRRVQQVGRGN
ncbi:penicillin-binding protein activator [Rhodopseudomonas palustris]|uniref:Penicillin-binding protein activator n=1 Tax=Thiospirillum jenense TaxID=1653858 RepID=A0A839HC30_9GAMM|nr:penicillin-binding protein activator [Thiospirillum jenense]MBB1089667.1 penicillin-binding protein activator [Rhodopseudomonas palustris]MBB1124767.1 penicillin-binding protein activator [Thiospirillum jenense]